MNTPYVTMITLEQFLQMKVNEEDFVLVDTLSKEEFDEGHLPGAIHLPSKEIAKLASDELSKDDLIVTYCGGYTCQASTIGAQKLLNLGHENVLDFKGGKEVWTNANFELDN